MIGELVGSYRIVSTLGTGGMGVVYLAEHQVIGRPAAIKVLLPELSHHREVVERFFNEARASAFIRHPGIVNILDFGHHHDGSAYIVMEYLEGESLGARLRRTGRLGEASAVTIARQAAGALAAAHARGIIHRDLKPDNIYLVPDADLIGGVRVKVLDFGIAKLSGAGAGQTVAKTRTGAVMGSPLYMSPEQSRGARAVDERSDVYSLGCVFFEMIAGRPPFVGEGAGEVIGKHIYEKPPRLRSIERGASSALDSLIARTLAKDPDRRPRSMTELIRAIDKATDGRYATQALPEEVRASSGGRAAPPVPTTLGSSIGEATEIPVRRRPWPLLLVSLAAAGGIAAAITASLSSTRPAQLAAAPPIEGAAVDAAPAQPSAAVAPPAAAPPASEPRKVTVRLTSTPPGATVTVNEQSVGTTPSELELPFSAAAETRVRLSLDGYRGEELHILPDRDRTRDVKLQPLRRDAEPRPAAPKPRAPREKGAPVDPFAPGP